MKQQPQTSRRLSKNKPQGKNTESPARPDAPAQPRAHAKKRQGAAPAAAESLHIIHKYANRRLYSISRQEHLTLDGLLRLAYEKIPFKVISVKTRKDLTHQVLLSAFLRLEKTSRSPLLSNRILLNLICLQASQMRGIVEEYLDCYFENLSKQIEPLYPEVGKIISGKDNTGSFLSVAQHNLNALNELRPGSKKPSGAAPSNSGGKQ